MLKIIDFENDNENHNEISTYPSENGYYLKNAGNDVEKGKPCMLLEGDVNWYNHYGKQYGGSSKITKTRTAIWFSNPTPGGIRKGNEMDTSKKHLHSHVY